MKNVLFVCLVVLSTTSFAKVTCADVQKNLSGEYSADYINHIPGTLNTTISSMGSKVFIQTSDKNYDMVSVVKVNGEIKTITSSVTLDNDETGQCYLVFKDEDSDNVEFLYVSKDGNRLILGEDDEDEMTILNKLD